MPYPYGMQNSPAVGNGLGGLPRREKNAPPKLVEFYFNDLTAQTRNYILPTGFTKVRVTLIAHGGPGASTLAGSGAGCAVSPVKPAVAGSTVLMEIAIPPIGTKTTSKVSFSDVVLSAESGIRADAPSNISGGNASGGEFNYRGGNASFSGTASQCYPGAGASPDGPGGSATTSSSGVAAGGDGALGTPAKGATAGPTPGAGADTRNTQIGGSEGSPAYHTGGPALVRIELW